MPVLQKLYQQVPECEPFLYPVDPIGLGIPVSFSFLRDFHECDYHAIIKHPMDLSTIKDKLDNGIYENPWEFIDDVGLMFDNAWLYNRKTSKVYKYCSKLSEVFDNEIDEAMISLGYCCGRRHVFSPQVLCCFGKQLCSIPRDTVYYNYLDRLVCWAVVDDVVMYIYCEKCFNELQGEEVEMVDDPSQPGLKIKKGQFVREKNDKLDHEQFVNCKECDRKMHKICVLHMENIWPEGFLCDYCLKALQTKRKENKYSAKRLPTTKLGTYLETRVNSLLKKKNSGAGEVTIRVLSSYDKVVEVKSGMKARYVNRSEMPEGYPYRVKAMFAFEEIDGIDVCFFGMHVQEYGSDCPMPNSRRVYIAYLDSVHFFQPRHLRTTVYHEILIGYLEYAKIQGYEWAHIWACPPSEGDDYIFHCHPPDQKIPKPKRLQDWYKKMLDKAYQDRVIIDYKDIYKDAIEGNITKVTDMPYFEGDFWPNILEECIKDLEQEEVEKRKRAEEEAAQDTDDFESDINDRAELETFAGKKKGQKSGNQKKKNTKSKKPSNRKNKTGLMHCGNDLSAKLLSTMEKHKEGFFVIRLQPINNCPVEIRDVDPLMNCDLMDGRDAFLTLARDKHYEFSSLRRAKYSSMGLLYELHNQARDGFIYSCNDCKANVETRYHCSVCDDYDLCVSCYKKSDHPHKQQMTRLGLDLDGDSSNDASNNNLASDQQNSKGPNTQEAKNISINSYISSLVHASHCRDANCRLNVCQKMKRFMQHIRTCKRRQDNSCKVCKQLLLLCWTHAKQCKESKCPVPFCINLKQKLEQQKAEAQFKNNQLMRRRMAIMQRQPALDRAEHTPLSNAPPNSDPPTPTAMGPPHGGGGYGGNGGKFLHHLGGSPPPSMPPHQAAMMAAHQAEQMAQTQRQVPPVYGAGSGG
ncbi:hypothetical protein HELRODRAFT_95876, partial [Helobdella robusta]|uniref:histone acetyltransferase n=1 Tax=Helobdella robusta TaxID=6412 RepID=T1G985_HELRO